MKANCHSLTMANYQKREVMPVDIQLFNYEYFNRQKAIVKTIPNSQENKNNLTWSIIHTLSI